MSTEQQNQGWLQSILEGGLPQVIAGPAGKAISRLIGAGVEIPAAWLKQKAQAIHDETKAKSIVMEKLAAKSAELGFSDPELLDRGLNNLLGKAYREQVNREVVAKKAIEYLADDPPPEQSPGPSDDWIDLFEGYAARATSENMRDLFARVLSGEIRKPGHFSPATLHFVSVLDGPTAKLIEEALPWCVNCEYVLKDAVGDTIAYGQWLVLEEAGFVTFGGGSLSRSVKPNEQKFAFFRMGRKGLLVQFPDTNERNPKAIKLTKAGEELAATIPVTFELERVGTWFWSFGAEQVFLADVVKDNEGNEALSGSYVHVAKPSSD
ncbi:DUF2806 domain-containing protein [Mesorhizobium sp. LMG17149]|uniref:DUF2806 domain-containing protein n=1 Tax=Mesorhizobium sp. LMG17149 TaxID=2968497 RepID=UPI0021178350|nr:DUF2806 domain-containing protein [Mesorhizobium sp. LMG17149]MCQ8876113.1 DUF2806 domain-containing protein [Mesorhizobium sp. LMG17149]